MQHAINHLVAKQHHKTVVWPLPLEMNVKGQDAQMQEIRSSLHMQEIKKPFIWKWLYDHARFVPTPASFSLNQLIFR